MNPLLVAHDLSFAYGGRPALRGINLTLAPGERILLLGPNGSGKSTLIKVLLGVLRGSGSIAWDNRPRAAWKRREFARFVAYLPQSPTWEPHQRVHDVLRLGRSAHWSAFGVESERDLRIVREVSALLELDDLLDRPISELSGGQRQRIFLGRCLVQEPRAMLLDEPGTFLDLRHQLDLLRLLQRLARERSIAILMASHDINLAAAFADRMVLLQEGTILADGAPPEVLNPELLGRVYGIPMYRIDRDLGQPPLVFPDLGNQLRTID